MMILITSFVLIGFVLWEKAISADSQGQPKKAVRLQNLCNAMLTIGLSLTIISVVAYWQGV